MPVVGDLIRITQCKNLLGQQACNVFYYVVALWTGALTIDEVLEVWEDVVFAPWTGYLSPALSGGTITWASLDNPAEIVTIPATAAGVAGGELMSSFMSIGIRLYGETAVTRSGWKRLAGITEANVANGEIAPAVLTAMQAAAQATFVEPVYDGGSPGTNFALEPVVVGRNPDGSLNITAVNPIVTATVQQRVTTQNTRKVGRGS